MRLSKRIVLASFFALLFGAVGLLAASTSANVSAQSTFVSGDTVTRSEPVAGSLFSAGSTIQVTDKVDGDIYVAGQTVTISGDVTGDVLVVGQTVIVSGKVSGNIRAVAQTVTVSSEVGGSISGLYQTLVTTGTAKVGRDIDVVGQSVTIDGQVGRDINGVVEKLYISGEVGRNVTYISELDLTKSGQATISGAVARTAPPVDKMAQPSLASYLTGMAYVMLSALLSVVLVTALFPRWLRSAGKNTYPRPWKALLVGFLATMVTPAALLFFAITIIGLPIAAVGLLLAVVVAALGFVFTSNYIGRLIFRDSQSLVLQSATGAIVYVVLLAIPYLGFFVWVIGGFIGTGTIVLDFARRLSARN